MIKMFKYRTNLGTEITKYKVINETKSRITFKYEIKFLEDHRIINKTESKTANSHSWHDTFEEAQNHLIKATELRIKGLKKQLEFQESQIEIIKSLKNID